LDRIKSVEFDLEKTKRVFIIHLCLLIILIWWCGFKICNFLQVLHAAVMKQLEITDLLENMQQPKCRVSWSLYDIYICGVNLKRMMNFMNL
jgi:hypothetical protein